MVGGTVKAQKLTIPIGMNKICPSPGAGNNPKLVRSMAASHKTASFALYSRALPNDSTPKREGQTTAFRALSGFSFPHVTSNHSAVTGGRLGPVHQPGPWREKILSC